MDVILPQGTHRMKTLALALTATLLLPVSASAATIFGVDETNQLVSFRSTSPGTFLTTKPITGATATFLAIDFRDSDNQLYGLTNDYGLYRINRTTGAATQIGTTLPITGTEFGFDFNTVVDMTRVVGDLDDNYVVNPDSGMVGQFTDVAFAPGDVNFGQDAIITANGYIHGTTTQYAIDTNSDSLVLQANNMGTLTTVGSLGIAVGPRTSFDIGYDGVGYIQNTNGFSTVNLETGAATMVGTTPRALFAISSAVPEPATWGMMLLGFGAIGSVVRRKRRVEANLAHA